MGEFKVGLLGAGQVARSQAAALSARDDCRLVGLYDPQDDRAASLSGSVEGLEALASVEAVLAADVDAVVITAPTQEHASLGTQALRAGKHVLMEKPFTRTTAEAEELGTLADELGLLLMPAQVARFLPAVTALREQVAAADVGPLVQAVERRFTHRTEVFGWWRDLPEFLIAHWGSHSLDVFLWLTGDEADDVACWASSRQAGYDGIDDFTLVTKTTSGAVLSLHQTYSSREELFDWTLVWEQGTGVIEELSSARWNREALVTEDLPTAIGRAFAAQAAEFVGSCRGERTLETTVTSLLPGMRALDRAIEAAGVRTGSPERRADRGR